MTPYGRIALSLDVVGVILILMWSVLGPLGAWPGFVCAAAGGVLALIGIVAQRDRGVVTFLLLLPLAYVIAFLVGELVLGHD